MVEGTGRSSSASKLEEVVVICSGSFFVFRDEDVERNHFKGGSHACTSELNLFYLCFGVLGDEMKMLTSINSILDATTERVLQAFLTNPGKTKLLVHLSTFSQIQEIVYTAFKDILQTLLLDDSCPLRVKEELMEIVRNLSRCVANKQSIYHDYYDILFLALKQDESLTITRYALGALNNLATLDENAVALFHRPYFLETILKLVTIGGTQTIKERALWTLQSLACADENEARMFNSPQLAKTLLHCLQPGATVEVKAYAIETLRNLANQNSRRMLDDHDLISALMDVVTSTSSPRELVELALSCFERLGLRRERVIGMHKMQILCCVRDAPRVCGATSGFGTLPVELVRRVGETLYAGRSGF